MNCLTIQTMLEAYVDGDLGRASAEALEHHLARCANCQAELVRLETVEAALESWPLVVEPASLTDQIMVQVRDRPALSRLRLHWSDLIISTIGAGLVSSGLLVYYVLTSTQQAHLYQPRVQLQREIMQLRMGLLLRHLSPVAEQWWPLGVGLAAIISLGLAAWAALSPHSALHSGWRLYPQHPSKAPPSTSR